MSDVNEKKFIKPQTLKGFRDYLPENLIAQNRIVEKIRKIFEKYGFIPLDTPILEYLMTLVGTGGEEINKQLLCLESPEKESVAMRFDLTVPLARMIAQYPDKINLPFRRYHIGPVFRADKPGKHRYRQFTQFDIDAVGSKSVAVDAEIIAAMCEVMREVGLINNESHQDFQIRINNRKLVDALLEGCGITDTVIHLNVLRVVDKLQKFGLENVRKLLGKGRIDESGDPIPGVSLPNDIIEKIISFISTSADSRLALLESVKKQLKDSELTKEALGEMVELSKYLDILGVKECDAIFDPSLARGLDYYTGPVFETILPAIPEVGSVMGGGRYDRLVERFMDATIPSTGASIGLERFMAALKQLDKIEDESSTTKVLILTMSGVSDEVYLNVAKELREAGINTEIYFGKSNEKMRDQLALANSRDMKIAVIIGEDEFKNNQVSIKDLKVGMEKRDKIQDRKKYLKAGKTGQITIDRDNLVEKVLEILNSQEE